MSVILQPTKFDGELPCPLCGHIMGFHWDHLINFPEFSISMRCDHAVADHVVAPSGLSADSALCRCQYYIDCIDEESDEVDPTTLLANQLSRSIHAKRS